MEALLPTNSRVTVECTDPANLFTSFEALLNEHLPLRNLHWKSPNRPLRSIDSLHITLTRAKDAQSEALTSNARRHQIPGLRQTPYLKIFLVRCDDNDTYKSSCRQQIRDWVKANTLSSDSKSSAASQETHDAYEWLIVHLVLPGTPAASQPQVSKHKDTSLGGTDSTDSLGSKSKWPGKGTRTVYEKIRADFNRSSKSAPDRVAQIRFQKEVTLQRSFTSVIVSTESKDQWDDLVEKLKNLILASFTLRVSQYEEDIRERDRQRNLPGWNFCTFFVLKEGLARGFESVGLLDDALAGYDELALGLDAAIADQGGSEADHGGTFLRFSKELKSMIRAVLEEEQEDLKEKSIVQDKLLNQEAVTNLDSAFFPLRADKKPYRDLILSNNISTFDFRTYIYARQMEILLRKGRGPLRSARPLVSAEISASTYPGEENCLPLAEICQRAMEFIPLAARTLRYELYQAWGGHDNFNTKHMKFQEIVIENIVVSWTYCASLQVLAQTSSTALVMSRRTSFEDGRSRSKPPSSQDQKIDLYDSLRHRRSSGDESLATRPSSQEILHPDSYSVNMAANGIIPSDSTGTESHGLGLNKTGIEDLAAWRAELCLLSRTTVENIGKRRGWREGLDELGERYDPCINLETGLENIALNDAEGPAEANSPAEDVPLTTLGLDPPALNYAAQSQQAFDLLYKILTDVAYGYFLTANKLKSAERAFTDLAVLKYRHGNYESAASCFEHIAKFYGTACWSLLGGKVLEVYTDCLRRLNRQADYTRSLLKLVSYYTADCKTGKTCIISPQAISTYFRDLWSLSKDLESNISIALTEFFQIQVDDLVIHHFDGKDGFYISLPIRSILETRIGLSDTATMFLTPKDESDDPDIMLNATLPVVLSGESVEVMFESKTTISGWYELKRLEIHIGMLIFVLSNPESDTSLALAPKERSSMKHLLEKPILVYPAPRSLTLNVTAFPRIRIPHPQSILLELNSGQNHIDVCNIRLRAAIAGLRLHIHQAALASSGSIAEMDIESVENQQVIRISQCRSGSTANISVPYTLEHREKTIKVQAETVYTVNNVKYRYFYAVSISAILPVSVKVQDIFKERFLYSRFTVSPGNLVPLHLEKYQLDNSENYVVETGVQNDVPMDVFPRQPASLLFKLSRNGSKGRPKQTKPLTLTLEYRCLDEVILSGIEDRFRKDIVTSGFTRLERLLTPQLLSAFRSQWTEQDLEVACLVQEMEVWPYENIGWETVLAGLAIATRESLAQWLREWHSSRPVVRFQDSTAVIRQISIPVDIPNPRLVVSASINFERKPVSTTPVALGEALLARLHISCSEVWYQRDVKAENQVLEISYEVVASPDIWLIGGQAKGNIRIDADGPFSFPIMLLPQRAGHLLLPLVEIKCFSVMQKDTRAIFVDRAGVSCEVDYKSSAKSVLVIPNIRETTVAVDGESGGRGSWLVDSKTREPAG